MTTNIPLTGKYGAGLTALVDDSDYELVRHYRWRGHPSRNTVYAIRSYVEDGKKRSQLMHCLIAGGVGTDHIDRNGLNNRRSNLRPATVMQNMANQGSRTGRFKGVSWARRQRKWIAKICVAYKQIHLGYFISDVEAALAYDAAARRLNGEYAGVNFVN
jgi:hypothetical protein